MCCTVLPTKTQLGEYIPDQVPTSLSGLCNSVTLDSMLYQTVTAREVRETGRGRYAAKTRGVIKPKADHCVKKKVEKHNPMSCCDSVCMQINLGTVDIPNLYTYFSTQLCTQRSSLSQNPCVHVHNKTDSDSIHDLVFKNRLQHFYTSTPLKIKKE